MLFHPWENSEMLTESFAQFETDLIEWISQFTQTTGINHSFDVPSQKEKELYYIAYHLYRDQQYREASYFFRFLVMAHPLEPKYWKGLGACLQMKQEYADALNCYRYTQLLYRDQPDPYLYLYSADCYFALKDIANGLKALEAARLSGEKTCDARILKHVALMKALWTQAS